MQNALTHASTDIPTRSPTRSRRFPGSRHPSPIAPPVAPDERSNKAPTRKKHNLLGYASYGIK